MIFLIVVVVIGACAMTYDIIFAWGMTHLKHCMECRGRQWPKRKRDHIKYKDHTNEEFIL